MTEVDILATIPVVMMFCLVSYFIVLFTTPKCRDWLVKNKSVAKDVNKAQETWVARPVSLPLIIGVTSSAILLWISFHNIAISAMVYVGFVAWLIGFLDDYKTQRGWFKPVMLLSCGAIIFVFNTYHNSMIFPIIGLVEIPHLTYVVLMIPIVSLIANTVNSIDVVNGAASGVMTIAAFSLAGVLATQGEYQLAVLTFPLGMVSYAFYKYHKTPATVFLGDSGALFLGAVFAAIAIIGNVEVFAFIILAPLVLNSFLFLASVRKIVEHREIKEVPVIHDDDYNLMNSKIKGAPITLVRLIVKNKPMSEEKVSNRIITLVTITSAIAIGLGYLT